MTDIVIFQQNASSIILRRERERTKASPLSWVPVRQMPTIFLLKAGGGVGADLFVSLTDKILVDVDAIRPFVIQMGGTRGPLANSHPSELYKHLDLRDPKAGSLMIDMIIANHGKRPVIVMVDPNYSGDLIALLEDMQAIGQRLNARGIVLVREESDDPKVIGLLGRVMTTWKGLVEPEFGEILGADMVRIPRLPHDLVNQIVREKMSVRDGLGANSPGTIIPLLRSLREFTQTLEIIYVKPY